MRAALILFALPTGAAYAAPAGAALVELDPSLIPPLRPIVERGDLALIESHKDGSMRQVTVIGLIDAPREVVFAALRDTDKYSEFVRNLVKSRTRAATQEGDRHVRDVEWELEIPLKNLEGVNRYTFEPPGTVRVGSLAGGNVGNAQWLWRLHESGKRTIAVLHGSADLRRTSWLFRRMIGYNKKAEHGIMLAGAHAVFKAVATRAAALAGRGRDARPAHARTKVELGSVRDGEWRFPFSAVEPLLSRGEAAFIQSLADGRLFQAVVIGNFYVPLRKAYQMATDVAAYARFIRGVKRSQVISDDGTTMVYEMEVEAPLLDIEYKNRVVRGPDWSRTDSMDGDLKDAHLRWEFVERGPQRTIALHYINANLRDNSWILRRLFQVEPYYEHGVNVAAALLTLTHVRGRAEGWLKPYR